MPDYDKIYRAGQWVRSAATATIPVVNPTTEQVIAAVPRGTAADVDAAVSAARAAFDGWWATPVDQRAQYVRRIADGLRDRAAELADVITQEVGSPRTFSAQVQVALPIHSFAEAANLLGSCPFEQTVGNSIVVREPIGVVGCITPWNYPLHQIAAKVAFAIAGGNTVVLKPSEVAPLNAWHLAEVIDEIGLPPGVFNLVSGTGEVVGEAIAAHPDVDMVSFTGSTGAGKRVSQVAAETVKRVALELGGKSPNVVLRDADLGALMPRAIHSAMLNSGQTCSALTRLIVPSERLAEAEDLARRSVESLPVGDPAAETTVLGPLVSAQQRDRVLEYIKIGIAEGAKLVTGGLEPIAGLDTGYYVAPTIFSDVTQDMTVHREEIFGPVLVIEPYETEEDAVRIANDTVYGLAAGVWSADPERARAVARRIRAGQVAINGGRFNPNAPFGGYKQSGNGREYGTHGLEEFLEVKSLQQ